MAATANSTTFEQDIAADGEGSGAVDDIFGDDDDELFKVPAPLPSLPPDDDLLGLNRSQDGGMDEGSAGEKKKATKKRSPQPRLNETRLCSDRGIPALAHLCDDIKFRGKGHEASDLKLLLQKYEHWAHRLYPKFPFDNVVEQVEVLGKKKLVQNAIKRARRGEEEEVNNNNSSDEESQVNGITIPPTTPSIPNVNFGTQPEAAPSPSIGLTPEQRERMRQNRLKAIEKRKALQEKAAQNSAQKDNSHQAESEILTTAEVGKENEGIEDTSLSKQDDDIEILDNEEIDFPIHESEPHADNFEETSEEAPSLESEIHHEESTNSSDKTEMEQEALTTFSLSEWPQESNKRTESSVSKTSEFTEKKVNEETTNDLDNKEESHAMSPKNDLRVEAMQTNESHEQNESDDITGNESDSTGNLKKQGHAKEDVAMEISEEGLPDCG